MEPRFRTGDIVRLKDWNEVKKRKVGFKMTVAAYKSLPLFNIQSKTRVYCVWFEGSESKFCVCHQDELELVKAANRVAS